MPISTIANGEAGSTARSKINSVIGVVNGLGTASTAATGDFATATQGALADSAIQGSTGANDNLLIRSDGTGGKTVQSSGISIDDFDNVTGVESIAAKGSGGLVLKSSAGATVATFGAGGTTVTLPSGTNIGNISATELGYLDGVTSALQTQIDGKAASTAAITIAGNSTALGGTVTQDQITGLSSTGIVKRTASNTLATAVAKTDYAPATSGSAILKGDAAGGFSDAAAGTDYVAPGAITTSGLTMATAKLLGRTTASTGAPEAISVGTGLSLSAGTLSSTVSGGKILQVVQATKTDTASVTGTTFTSLFSASITPSSSSSTVLVMVTLNVGGATNNWPLIRLTRSSTTLLQGDAASNRVRVTTVCGAPNSSTSTSAAISYLDSPASTSAQTYNIEVASQSSGTIYLNRSVTDTDTTAFQRGASTIILMEVAA